MYAFFEMEMLYDLRLKEIDGQICIGFGESQKRYVRVSIMNKKPLSLGPSAEKA